MANTSIKATIQSTQNPVVTKIIKNQTTLGDVTGINYNTLFCYAILAIQELTEKVAKLEERIA